MKTDSEDFGEDGGISFEMDPVKHREVAKRLSPAFSARNNKAKEATLQKYIDLFVKRMKEIGRREDGVEMREWADWLAMDISADMTYNRQMSQMRDCTWLACPSSPSPPARLDMSSHAKLEQ